MANKPEYQGDEFLFAVVIPGVDPDPDTTARVFNQTDGGRTIEADSVDLSTKDKTGSGYGPVTESVSLEGVLTENDPAITYIEDSIRGRQFVEILKINTRTLDAERGSYMLSSFEETYSNGEFSTYSVEASLNGVITKETVTQVPAGA
ncbi:MAG TPA: phage major tail protein, TP901-1 family [Balneolaceae bacterium]|nr:phage major tail protein, TP901-1 family [Balneolaceae bacterium]